MFIHQPCNVLFQFHINNNIIQSIVSYNIGHVVIFLSNGMTNYMNNIYLIRQGPGFQQKLDEDGANTDKQTNTQQYSYI